MSTSFKHSDQSLCVEKSALEIKICELSLELVPLRELPITFIVENNGDNDERFGVWANGVLTETPSKNLFVGKKFILLED